MSPLLPAPKAVLFDWDDTLVDNWGAITHALNTTFAAHGMEQVSIAEARRRATRSLRDSFPQIFGAGWEGARDLFLATFAEQHIAALEIKPGAVALLDLLGQAGIPTAVVSNKNGAFLREEAAHLDWTGRFVSLVGAGDAAADKPDPAVVMHALSGTPAGPGAEIAGPIAIDQTVWLIGDTAVDMACASATGCTGILVDWYDAHARADFGQQQVVATLDDVRKLVTAACRAI